MLSIKEYSVNLKPTYDNLLINPRPPITQIGRVTIPGNAEEKHVLGDVLQVGPGMYNEAGIMLPLLVKKGDVVLYAKASGKETKLDGQTYIVLKETDVICVVEE